MYMSKLVWKMRFCLWNISIFATISQSHECGLLHFTVKPQLWLTTLNQLRIQFHLYWFWKENFYFCLYLLYFLYGFTWAKKYCKIKKFSKHNSQLAELYYCYTEWKTVVHVLCISLLFLSQSRSTMKKIAAVKVISSNKTGILSFPQKCLFTLRMVKVL